MSSSAPGTFHLAGGRRIYGGAPWHIEFTLGRWVDDVATVAESPDIVSPTAGFAAGDVGAEVMAVDPDREEGRNELTGAIPKGTRILSVADPTHATLEDVVGVTDSALVVRILARDLTSVTFHAAIKADATDVDPIEEIAVAALGGTPRGRVGMDLTDDQTLHLAEVIGSPRPAVARGTFDAFEIIGGIWTPILAGAAVVERPVSLP